MRLRLLVSFIAFALFVLIIFGAVTYQLAVDNAVEKETRLLHHFVIKQASLLATQADPLKWEGWLRTTSPGNNEYVVLRAGEADQLQTSLSSLAKTITDSAEHKDLTKRIAAGEHSGQVEFAGNPYIWVAAAVGTGPYTLVTLHPLKDELFSPIKALGVRMTAAGVIIIWIAVWGALILSGLFMKRQEKYNADLVHQALHDELTGLPKRKLLYDRLQRAIYQAQRGKHCVALLIMDLDRFKEINDTLGHHCGDELLKQIGNRLNTALRKSDTIARLGGDEFAILAPEGDAEQAVQLANKVTQIMGPSHTIHEMEVSVQPSIGIAIYPEHGEDADMLMRHADVAMYQSKQQGGGISVYVPESDPHSLQRLTLISDLRHAVENESLMLYYQPEIDPSSGNVTGVEALARWNHPKMGLIRPDEFIQIAEKSGQIKALTELVIRQAFQQHHAWQRTGTSLKISINLSARNLHDMQLPAYIGQQLAVWNVPPGDICLEITESAMLIDPARARQNLTAFDEMGLLLAIDDFGTGYSSLAYLKQLPVSIIKIDKSFVMDMVQDENDASIVRATIDLAHNLGLRIVAEGVENRETLSALQSLGCDFLQGYYISKPVPPDELIRWLTNRQVTLGVATS